MKVAKCCEPRAQLQSSVHIRAQWCASSKNLFFFFVHAAKLKINVSFMSDFKQSKYERALGPFGRRPVSYGELSVEEKKKRTAGEAEKWSEALLRPH